MCRDVQPIPPGVDQSLVRCPHIEALWHASYDEMLIRLQQTRAHVDMVISEMTSRILYLEGEKKSMDKTADAIHDDAARLAALLG